MFSHDDARGASESVVYTGLPVRGQQMPIKTAINKSSQTCLKKHDELFTIAAGV
jgi:hypothetical protein